MRSAYVPGTNPLFHGARQKQGFSRAPPPAKDDSHISALIQGHLSLQPAICARLTTATIVWWPISICVLRGCSSNLVNRHLLMNRHYTKYSQGAQEPEYSRRLGVESSPRPQPLRRFSASIRRHLHPAFIFLFSLLFFIAVVFFDTGVKTGPARHASLCTSMSGSVW